VYAPTLIKNYLFLTANNMLWRGKGRVEYSSNEYEFGIQYVRHVIEFVFVETNHLVVGNPKAILTRQTCGQRSSMAVGSTHQALAFIFWSKFAICS